MSQLLGMAKNAGNSVVLGVIPARGGSKGVPGKNIRTVLGKPLIGYAIACARECPSLSQIIVSTDSPEIAEVAKRLGAEVPFLRPAELAQDDTPMLPVLQHAIEETERTTGKRVEAVVLMDPTAPLREPADIEGSLKLLRESNCDAVISGSPARRNPYFNMVRADADGFIQIFNKSDKSVGRRQDAPQAFDLNTVVWVFSRYALMEEKARIPKKSKLYEIPVERTIDLDHEFDFTVLELLLQRRQGKA